MSTRLHIYLSPQKYEINKIWVFAVRKSKARLLCKLPLSLKQPKLVLSLAGLMRAMFHQVNPSKTKLQNSKEICSFLI